ncbi:unnamed protein product [Coffea canephora]|uniref:1-deoxy-D-xylulose-5-phosphate reductoisomerase n=1 Tax=Coffea canephora TaxID=49390 RepID=A0A068VF47_COFCA|nr:unnamed protein product [Coffea canephora]
MIQLRLLWCVNDLFLIAADCGCHRSRERHLLGQQIDVNCWWSFCTSSCAQTPISVSVQILFSFLMLDLGRVFEPINTRDWLVEKLKDVKVADALKHPNWNMGKKITVDSATLFN